MKLHSFNWGHKIAIAYLVFVAGILFLVYKASNEGFDLVETNYYEAELRYQETIDARQRAQHLSQPLLLQQSAAEIKILFPPEFKGKNIEGTASLYYPANEKKDVTQRFLIMNNELVFSVPTDNKGLHHFKLMWKVEGVDYFHEQTIYL